MQQLFNLSHRGVYVDNSWLDDLFAAEGEELHGERCGAFGGALDRRGAFSQVCAETRLIENFAVSQDHAQ